MNKILILVFGLILGNNLINCMDKEKKSHEYRYRFLPEIYKIIIEYAGHRYHPTWQFNHTDGGHLDAVVSLTYSPGSKHLVSCTRDGTLKLWNTDYHSANNQPCTHTIQSTDEVYCISYSPCGKYLASGNHDNTIKLWDMNANSSKYKQCIYILQDKNDHHKFEVNSLSLRIYNEVNSLSFSPDGKYLASGSCFNIKLWDMDPSSAKYNQCIDTFNSDTAGCPHRISSLAYSPCGKYLASGSLDGNIIVWNMRNAKKRRLYVFDGDNGGHTWQISSISYSPNGKYLASCSRDLTIKLWNVDPKSKYKQCIHTWNELNRDEAKLLSFSPCSKYLVSSDYNSDIIKLWDTDANSATFKKCISILPRTDGRRNWGVFSLSFAPCGKYLTIGYGDGVIRNINFPEWILSLIIR